MIQPVYSVAIRAVSDNEYLKRTLDSLERQSLPPAEVIIVIPLDAQPWVIGNEKVRILQAERGMVTQRTAGILGSHCHFLLLMDDDIVLERTAAEVLVSAAIKDKADCVVPYWPEGWPKEDVARKLMSFWKIAIPRPYGGIVYTSGGGYYYPNTDPGRVPWETHGGAGAVILLNREFALSNHVHGDKDLQGCGPYALRDDAALIMQIIRKEGRSIMIGGVRFCHLGGTTRLLPERLQLAYRASVVNHYIFWKKYIKPMHSKSSINLATAWLCLSWYMLGVLFLGGITACKNRTLQPIRGFFEGLLLSIGK